MGLTHDLIRWGIEERDWKKIEEAAELMGLPVIYPHKAPKPNLSSAELQSVIPTEESAWEIKRREDERERWHQQQAEAKKSKIK